VQPVGKPGLRLSVIVTTYDNPRVLSLVLAGLARQTIRDCELLIADDGSGPETKTVIDEFRSSAPFTVKHIWHPDEGFRKCTILNKAILAATGTYLVFFDGDCVPSPHNLAAHVHAAARQRYVAGGAVCLSDRFSRQLTVAAVLRGDLDRIGWWWREVDKPRRLLVNRLPLVRFLLDRNVRRPPGWRGGNSSTFAEYVHQVGGFDERFTYGWEDADFGHRLEATGVIGYSLRYTAPVFHLEHPRPWARPEVAEANRALYAANRAVRMTTTPYGLHHKSASGLPTK
jgi:glycosyltransferase involved in cell wall biosynthesis